MKYYVNNSFENFRFMESFRKMCMPPAGRGGYLKKKSQNLVFPFSLLRFRLLTMVSARCDFGESSLTALE